MAPPTNTAEIALKLQAHAAVLQDELGRTYAALRALRGQYVSGRLRETPMSIEEGTTLGAVFQSWQAEPGRVITAQDAVEMARESGWNPTSNHPLNAMRQALKRGVDGGVLVRMGPNLFVMPMTKLNNDVTAR